MPLLCMLSVWSEPIFPRAVEDGQDLAARGQMQIAALLAGWAFSNAMVGLVHAMAHSLGAVCGIPHGLANGLILPHVMEFNLSEVPELLADIASLNGRRYRRCGCLKGRTNRGK